VLHYSCSGHKLLTKEKNNIDCFIILLCQLLTPKSFLPLDQSSAFAEVNKEKLVGIYSYR